MVRRSLVVTLLAACWGADVPAQDAGPGDDAAPVGPCTLPRLDQAVATLAGCKEPGTTDGARGEARFHNPTNVALAPNGIAYITDFDSHRVRVIDATGTTSTLYAADDFQRPFGIVYADGVLYVETDDNDRGEHTLDTGTIWRIDPVTRTARVVARDLGRPRGLALLADGRIAMSDHMHHTISILDPATGAVTLLAGKRDEPGYANGTDARFAQPYDIVVASDGALLVADMDNHRIRRVTLDGVVGDFAGSGDTGALDGPCAVATFAAPQSLAMSSTRSGDVLYIGDVKRKQIRRVTVATCGVSTIAGDGTPGWLDDPEPRNARFYGVEGLDVDGTRLVIADGNVGDGKPYHHVRVIELPPLL